jgi:HEAT repeat protein
VLALGISANPRALPLLISLVKNDPHGKKLAQRDDVGDRTRAFAAYGLGMLARGSEDVATKQEVHEALLAVLKHKEVDDRDMRVAIVGALGISCGEGGRSTHKRLAWITVEALLDWYQLDLGRGDEAVQAHAPVAIGRLLGRGSSRLHQSCKEHFIGVLNATSRRSNPILQSAALALGMLAMPPETGELDAQASRALQQFFQKGHDRLARYLCLAALGRIGGEANRRWLIDTYGRANKNTERPWLAIALGLIDHAAADRGDPDESWAQILASDLPAASKPEAMSAFAVALGLTRYSSGQPLLSRMLRENEHDETLAGYLCIGLALLGDAASVPEITAVMERSQRRPFLLLQSAVALGRLGDRNATDRLLEMLDNSQSVAVLAAIANAIGQIGDRRAIEPLITRAKDDQITKLARAFVAAALGAVGDRRPLPWNLPLSKDCNYGAPVDTLSNGSTGILDIL